MSALSSIGCDCAQCSRSIFKHTATGELQLRTTVPAALPIPISHIKSNATVK